MLVLYIKRAANAAPSAQAQGNSVEQVLLGVVDRRGQQR